MIELHKPGGIRRCNCCSSDKNVLDIYFRSDHVNSGICVALCEICQEELTDKLVKEYRENDVNNQAG